MKIEFLPRFMRLAQQIAKDLPPGGIARVENGFFVSHEEIEGHTPLYVSEMDGTRLIISEKKRI